MTALSVLGAAQAVLILGVLARGLWRRSPTAVPPEVRPWQVVFLLVVGILNFGPMAFSYSLLFDRYLLTFMPLILGLLVALAPAGGEPLVPGVSGRPPSCWPHT